MVFQLAENQFAEFQFSDLQEHIVYMLLLTHYIWVVELHASAEFKYSSTVLIYAHVGF